MQQIQAVIDICKKFFYNRLFQKVFYGRFVLENNCFVSFYMHAFFFQEMNRLPDSLLAMPSTRLVTSWYKQSFGEVVDFDKNNTNPENLIK